MTSNSPYSTVAIIGVGMMGGSLAMLIKSVFPTITTIGVARRTETAQFARQNNVVDEVVSSISELPQTCELAIICTSIDTIATTFRHLADHFQSSITITDIASVKEGLNVPLAELPPRHRYILGHPMAGIEKTGIASANPNILKNARYLLTATTPQDCQPFADFLVRLSFKPTILPPHVHDKIVAAGSHIPYLMAVLTAANAARQNQQTPVAPALGPGFRDTTRVTGSDPTWGRDICHYNNAHLLDQLTDIHADLSQLLEWLKSDDAKSLTQWLSQTRQNWQGISQI